ncbi:hypothetical protein KY284_030005 [Solanum tuberosum]|nr:hypothetical protein KY284_030005 [Solanum tuberosum]
MEMRRSRCCCFRLRWGSPVITLPSPELAARRSLVRAAEAAVCCCRPHWSGGEERKRLAGRSWSRRRSLLRLSC